MLEHVVTMTGPAMPLEKYLARAYPMIPGRVLRQALKKRDVRVDGVRAGEGTPVRAGNTLRLYVGDEYAPADLPILYEDGGVVAVEKPPGLPVDVDSLGVGVDTVLERLRRMRPGAVLCHRLDTGTGGVLIAAQNESAEAAVRAAMESHVIDKRYRCVVVGRPPKDGDTLSAFLIKDAAGSRVRVTGKSAPGALPIVTGYTLLRHGGGLSLLDIRLLTGRTHQIRAHMSYIGCPVLGDDKYGDREANRRYRAAWPQLWCRAMTWEGHVIESEPRFARDWFAG